MNDKALIKSNILSGLIIALILFAYQYLIAEVSYFTWGIVYDKSEIFITRVAGEADNSLIFISLFIFSIIYGIGYEFTYKESVLRIIYTFLCYSIFVVLISDIPPYSNRDHTSDALNLVLRIIPLIAIAIRELIYHGEVDEQKCYAKGVFKQVGIAVTWLAVPPLFYEWSTMNKYKKIILCAISPATIFIACLLVGAILIELGIFYIIITGIW